ncbi:hypothetical protein BGZ96_003643 [Linnemannia gamsii]|uniref:Uncharacterized protein n=1 Tax=Linnemannia gamsii TaxID=64522 RepID=A0ABQ7KF29_9FUNG|nr:hypothetical protein BGZ96_003643 [Linnemannia gamsii]
MPAPALVPHGQAALVDSNPDPEERPKSGGKSKKKQPQKDFRSTLKDLDVLGRHEIDAKKAVELLQLELTQQKDIAQIESSRAIKLAEINAEKEVRWAAELAQSERDKMASLQQSQIQELFRLVQHLAGLPRAKYPSSSLPDSVRRRAQSPLTPQVPAFFNVRPRQKKNFVPLIPQEIAK